MLQSINSWGKSRQQTSEIGIICYPHFIDAGHLEGFETIDDAEAAQAGREGMSCWRFLVQLSSNGLMSEKRAGEKHFRRKNK